MRLPKPLSAHTLLGPSRWSGGGATTVTLDFKPQVQSQTNWCWAAVSTSVGLFYGTGNWTQCGVATAQANAILDPGGVHDCCATPGSSTCNQYGYLNPALHHVGAYASATSGKAPADAIFSHISGRREVVCVRVEWKRGGAHFTTIHGFTDPSSGGDVFLTVSDTISGWGSTTMLYSDFPREYHNNNGTWTDTYWTRNVFGPSTDYGSGEQNSIAIDNNAKCVALHTRSGSVYSQAGNVDFINQSVDWGPTAIFGDGESASIDVDDFGMCVGVFTNGGRQYYRVGRINLAIPTIDWAPSAVYADGDCSDIALAALSVCVSVYVNHERLYYRMGWVEDDATISWMRQIEYGNGVLAAIAMDSCFNCVEVHVGAGVQSGRLFYRVGRLDVLRSMIAWGPSVEFDRGCQVDLSINNRLTCRAVFVDDSSGVSELYYRLGTMDVENHTIEWAPRTHFDHGHHASVAINDSGKSVEVHAASGRLLSKVGQ